MSAGTSLCLLLLEALIVLGCLARAVQAWRGTTLLAPLVWAGAVVVGIVAVEAAAWLGWLAPQTVPALRYLSAVSSFCPLVAVLGAKRPQDRAWQFVVLSLLATAFVPAGQWLWKGTGPEPLHTVPAVFMLALIFIGLTNYLPTRYALPALLASLGQVVLLGPYLPWNWGNALGELVPLVSLSLIALAGGLAWLLSWRRPQSTWPLNRIWVDFRNGFGVVWALRVAERVNAMARQSDWALRLSWDGFSGIDDEPLRHLDPQVEADLLKLIRTLLRRFVSPAWIQRRLIPFN